MKHKYWMAIVLFMGIADTVWAQELGVVRATDFVLVDDQGRNRAELGMGPLRSMLRLLDENGKGRIMLAITRDGQGLYLHDENKICIGLEVDKDEGTLALFDKNGKPRIGLKVSKDLTGLDLYDDNGEVRIGLIVNKNGPMLGLRTCPELVDRQKSLSQIRQEGGKNV